MSKLSYAAKRALKMDWGRMLETAKMLHKKTGKSTAWLLKDMVQCALRYNAGYMDYKIAAMYNLNDDPEVTTEKMVKNEYYDGVPYYRIGDVVKDEDGALWFCVQPSGSSTATAQFIKSEGLDALKETYKLALDQYSWFISLTPKSKDGELLFYDCGKYYSNLPTRDQARIISYYIADILWNGVMSKKGKDSELGQCYTNILDYAHVDLLKVVARRDSLYSALTDKANHICNIFTITINSNSYCFIYIFNNIINNYLIPVTNCFFSLIFSSTSELVNTL